MDVYLITHSRRFRGYDPGHTKDGLKQISSLPIPRNIRQIVSGTGKRFLEILEIVSKKLHNVPVKYSLYCGGPEGYEKTKDGTEYIVLRDRSVNLKTEYISVPKTEAWRFIRSLPNNTLLCAGGGLITDLGLEKIYQSGRLYKLNPNGRKGKIIA